MTEITTAEELDALPESDVLLLASGTYPRDRGGFFECWVRPVPPWITGGEGPRCWEVLTYGDTLPANVVQTTDLRLPITVLYRPDAPALSDAALIEEAARRGMSVMDAAEAARLRGVEAESETWHRAYDVDKAFRARVEKLADEWARLGGPKTALDLPIHLLYVNDLRALLHGDIESEVSA